MENPKWTMPMENPKWTMLMENPLNNKNKNMAATLATL
jgi:hypothetical protein